MIYRFFKSYKLKKRLIGNKKNIIIEGSNFECNNPSKVKLDEYIYVGRNCKFYGIGEISISKNVIIGNDTKILTSSHNYNGEMIPYDTTVIPNKEKVIIEKNVWIASYVIILPGVKIGEGAVIGAGSVVTKDVPKLAVVAGNPAKVIKYRNNEEYDNLVKNNKLYLYYKYNS